MPETTTQTSDGSTTTPEATATTDASTTTTVPGAGTQAPAGYVPQSELEKAQATARGLQSEKDKLAAKLRELQSAPTTPEAPATTTNQPTDTAALIQAMERRMELREARMTARSNDAFKDADPSLFDRATEFDSVEAFYAALEASAEQRKTFRETIRQEERDAVLAEIRQKYPNVDLGGTQAPPTTTAGAATTGAMTAEQLAAMPMAEADAWITANPDAYEALLRSVA